MLQLLIVACLQSDEKIHDKLEKTRIDLKFDNAKPEDVVSFLRDFSGINVVIDASARDHVDLDRPVTLHLKSVTLATALYWLADQVQLKWSVQEGVVRFRHSTEPVVRKHRLIRRTHTGASQPRVELQDGFSIVWSDSEPSDPIEEQIDLLKEFISPGSWEGDHTIEVAGENLLVGHTAAAHAEIEEFFSALRRMEGATITVEADLIEVPDALAGHSLAAALDAETAKKIRAESKSLRRLRVACREAETVYATSSDSGYAEVLGVTAVRLGDRLRLRLTLDSGVTRGRRSLAQLRTDALVPDGGSTLVHLPGRRALLVRASCGGKAGARQVELFRPDPAEETAVRATLKSKILSLDRTNAPLPEVIDYLREQTGLNFVISRSIESPDDEVISIQVKNISADAVLRLILGPQGMAFAVDREAVRIGRADELEARTHVYVADIRALVRDSLTCDDVASLVKCTIRKDDWEEGDGKSIVATSSGLLVVRNESDVIEEVHRFLTELRAQPERIVTLEAQWITLDAKRARELLDGVSGSLLTPAEAERLASEKGAVVDRLTLRGLNAEPLRADWCEKDAQVAEAATSRLRARVSPREGGADVELELDDAWFGPAAEKKPPTRGGTSLRSSLLIPDGQAAFFELPHEDGRTRVLVLRVVK